MLLKKISKKLRLMAQNIKITETNLLDVATIINYEIVQVDRVAVEVKEKLKDEKIPLPKVE